MCAPRRHVAPETERAPVIQRSRNEDPSGIHGNWFSVRRRGERRTKAVVTYPGTQVDARFAEGGRSVTIPTFIGPQTLLTDATVTFAYLIEQKGE